MFLVVSGEAVLSACQQACRLIDLRGHSGAHPCMGAVDLMPIYPLGEEVGLEECGKEARGEEVHVRELNNADLVHYMSFS